MRRLTVVVLMLSMTASILGAEGPVLEVVTLEYPLFIYAEGGEARGPLVDIVEEIFKRLDLRVRITIYPVSRGLIMVADGSADAFFSLKRTAEREVTMLFTKRPLIS